MHPATPVFSCVPGWLWVAGVQGAAVFIVAVVATFSGGRCIRVKISI